MKASIIGLMLILSISAYAPEVNDIKLRNRILIEAYEKIKRGYEEQQFNIRCRTTEFSVETFREALERYVQHPEIVYQQALLETGRFKSKSFTEYNNPFGMKRAKLRDTNQDGEGLGHASYNHWLDAVLDYALWQEFWEQQGYDISNYYSFLKILPYAEDRKYIQKLKQLV